MKLLMTCGTWGSIKAFDLYFTIVFEMAQHHKTHRIRNIEEYERDPVLAPSKKPDTVPLVLLDIPDTVDLVVLGHFENDSKI